MNPATRILIFATSVLVWACTSPPDPKPTTETAPVDAPATASDVAANDTAPSHPKADPIKIQAPVELSLGATGTAGTIQVTLTITATANLPEVVGRFVVPAGVAVVEGTPQRPLGPLAAGETAKHTVTLEVPAEGRYRLGAGVECVMGSALTLSAGKSLILGDGKAPNDDSRIIRPGNGHPGLRLSPAKRR